MRPEQRRHRDGSVSGPSRFSETTIQSRDNTANEAVILLDELGTPATQYQEWLEPRYTTKIAQSIPDAIQCLQRAPTEAVIFEDSGFNDTAADLSRQMATVDGHYQTIVVTGRKAVARTHWHAADECIHPPVDEDGVRSCVERARLVTAYDTVVTELLAIGLRRAVLREGVAPERMESNVEYRRLTDRIETLHRKLAALHELIRMKTDIGPVMRTEYDLEPDDFDWM